MPSLMEEYPPEIRNLVEQMIATPEDYTLLLVLADWCEERGWGASALRGDGKWWIDGRGDIFWWFDRWCFRMIANSYDLRRPPGCAGCASPYYLERRKGNWVCSNCNWKMMNTQIYHSEGA